MAGIRILVVDDAARVRQDLCQMLSLFCEFEIVGEAQDGLQAVRQARDLRPDVILMDLEMPEMDGYTATLQIKAFYPDCRIIAYTVYGYEEAREKALQSGVDSFIVKGEPIENLVGLISNRRS